MDLHYSKSLIHSQVLTSLHKLLTEVLYLNTKVLTGSKTERQVSSLFEMRVGKRAWPLVKAGAVVMALPLVGAGTMQV